MEQYRAPRWLVGGNAQTIWPALFSKRYLGAPPQFVRERWSTPDGDFVDVDWQSEPGVQGVHGVRGGAEETGAADGPDARSASSASSASSALSASSSPSSPIAQAAQGFGQATQDPHAARSERPLLVLFHGLEGSSSSHYAQAFAHWARSHGWRFALPHFRGCSGELNLAPRAYHSGDFEEVGWMLQRLRAAHRGPIAAVGISLGGNALLRWAEEAGANAGAVVSTIAAVSAPIDLAAGGGAIGRGFNRQVYTRMFLRTMKPKALHKLAQHPGLFDRERLLAARTLYEFDDVFTAPLHGFRDTRDYWSRGSAKPHLDRIRIPALVLNARNDPFVPAASLPHARDVGPCVTLWQPRHGGHVGFAGGRWPGHVLALPEHVMGWIGTHIGATSE